ncbi:MAG: HNH endonuclease [Gemmatales bacterium]
MRPVLRGNSPRPDDYPNYRDSFPELAGRIGLYCSYCERRIATQLAVEHIQPKALPAYETLKGRWDNFLLGCVNCNSTKGDKDVVLADILLPDRDNTGTAYEYTMDGQILVRNTLTAPQKTMANRTLALVGLDKLPSQVLDSNGQLVAIDRVTQRMEAWLMADESRRDLQTIENEAFRRQIVRTAVALGFFSIWMTVFAKDVAMRKMLISGFRGTATDCYDANTTFVSPRPATGLTGGSKV